MRQAISKICELLENEISIPVFDYSFPAGYSSACLVVKENSFDEDSDEGEYSIDIYAPNTTRIVDGITDTFYPDMPVIENLADQVLSIFRDLWQPEFSGWAHKRQLIKEGNMHYLNICLTIQFF